jgi:hypothetical protein
LIDAEEQAMIKTHRFVFSALVYFTLFLQFSGAAPANTINFDGKEYYINGINVPWNSFGSDVGTHHEWGALYDPEFFTGFFQECSENGINCVRLWIHCDGRSTPEFDDDGSVTGLDANFLSDFDALLKIARDNSVMVMPCLWSFDMTKDFTADAGKYAGMHADLIQDSTKTRSYINNALIPMVEHLAYTDNLFAWEIINEPEWSIEGPGTTTQLVGATEMVRFCGMIAEAIHEHSDKMVTVGSACLKWHSSLQPPAEEHYWSDASFRAAYNKPGSHLDFYQIHYYDWMYNPDWGYDPFQNGRTPDYWQLDKPTIIGESPAMAGEYTVQEMVDAAYANDYAGIMPWSYNALDGHGTWEECKRPLKDFRDAHAAIVDYFPGVYGAEKRKYETTFYRAREGVNITVFDLNGRMISRGSGREGKRGTMGVFIRQFRDAGGSIVGTQKKISEF